MYKEKAEILEQVKEDQDPIKTLAVLRNCETARTMDSIASRLAIPRGEVQGVWQRYKPFLQKGTSYSDKKATRELLLQPSQTRRWPEILGPDPLVETTLEPESFIALANHLEEVEFVYEKNNIGDLSSAIGKTMESYDFVLEEFKRSLEAKVYEELGIPAAWGAIETDITIRPTKTICYGRTLGDFPFEARFDSPQEAISASFDSAKGYLPHLRKVYDAPDRSPGPAIEVKEEDGLYQVRVVNMLEWNYVKRVSFQQRLKENQERLADRVLKEIGGMDHRLENN